MKALRYAAIIAAVLIVAVMWCLCVVASEADRYIEGEYIW